MPSFLLIGLLLLHTCMCVCICANTEMQLAGSGLFLFVSLFVSLCSFVLRDDHSALDSK